VLHNPLKSLLFSSDWLKYKREYYKIKGALILSVLFYCGPKNPQASELVECQTQPLSFSGVALLLDKG
jgi:hypothetical protein